MYSRIRYNKSAGYGRVFNSYLSQFESEFCDKSDQIKSELAEIIYKNGKIDADAIQKEWFPTLKADIFISHSHKDLSIAKAVAGWLKEKLNLSAFIDYYAWGCCDELLKKIDDLYCKNKDNTYNYQLRNFTTSHVHTILSNALTKIINNTECILFINTPESVSVEKSILDVKEHKTTTSPWIFHELSISSSLPQIKPKRLQKSHSLFENIENIRDSKPSIEYTIDEQLKSFYSMSELDFEEWAEEASKRSSHPLDVLYKIIKLK